MKPRFPFAGFPTVYPTSYAGLVFRARLRAGETLLHRVGRPAFDALFALYREGRITPVV